MHNLHFDVIPAKVGIQEVLMITKPPDTGFRGYDGFFEDTGDGLEMLNDWRTRH